MKKRKLMRLLAMTTICLAMTSACSKQEEPAPVPPAQESPAQQAEAPAGTTEQPAWEAPAETAGNTEEPAASELPELESQAGSTQNAPSASDLTYIPYQTIKNYDYLDNENVKGTSFSDYVMFASLEVEGITLMGQGNDALQKALQELNVQRMEQRNASRADMEEVLPYEEDNATFPWNYNDDVYVKRSDEKVFSFISMTDSFMGGAHGSYWSTAYNLDAATGKQLALRDICLDYDKLYELTIAKLEELNTEEFFPDWKDTVFAEFYPDQVENPFDMDYYVDFCLTAEGMEIDFDTYEIAPYSNGAMEVDFTYEELSGIIHPSYAISGGLLCEQIYPWFDYEEDFDGDGDIDYLSVALDANYNQEFDYIEDYKVDILYGEDAASIITISQEYVVEADAFYVMQNAQGTPFLYLVEHGYSDWETIYVYDLSDPSKGAIYKGLTDDCFYGYRPVSPNQLIVKDRMYVMGTFSGWRTAYVGADGMFASNQDYYFITSIDYDNFFTAKDDIRTHVSPYTSLTTAEEVTGEYFEDFDSWESWNGTEGVVPVGSVLYPYISDGENYMVFKTEDGRLLQLTYDGMDDEGWTKTINGISEYNVFEMVLYAD